MVQVLRWAAFTDTPTGGNPAGVVLAAEGLTSEEMLSIAADVGYSETAFLGAEGTDGRHAVRYFSPLAEVPFCGHATIATAVAHAASSGAGELVLATRAGEVRVTMAGGTATLTSVDPRTAPLDDDDLATLLTILRWSPADLDPDLPPRVAYAGAHHPVLGTSRERLAALDYDFSAATDLMAARGWTTLQLVHREDPLTFHSRNPFPPGGIVEDPATGAAAAALGGYLRDLGLVDPPATVTVHQGVDLGRPSLLTVSIPRVGGIGVTGAAIPL